jgi:alkylation response protein AidB-like acyl-CoA dehydrogenase
MPGVRIKDNGPKAGLNGVDNGQIWFDDVRVPRDDMLDAFASVAPDGTQLPVLSTCCTTACCMLARAPRAARRIAAALFGALQGPTAVRLPMLVPGSARWWAA